MIALGCVRPPAGRLPVVRAEAGSDSRITAVRALIGELPPGAFVVPFDLSYEGPPGPLPVTVTAVAPTGESHDALVVLEGRKGAAVYRAAFSPSTPAGRHRFRFAAARGEAVEATVNVAAGAAEPLAVTGFSPGGGRPGAEVAVSGHGFAPGLDANAVFFAGVAAEVLEAGPEKLLVTVPRRAVSGRVAVANERGLAVSPGDFKVPAGIAISGLGQEVVRPGESAAFFARLEGVADPGVRWSASAGAITADGVYTAPRGEPADREAVITARAVADDRLVATRSLRLAPPAPAARAGVLDAAGGRLVSASGLLSLEVPPAALPGPTRLQAAAAFLAPEPWPEGVPKGARPLAEIEMTAEKAPAALARPVAFTLVLPTQLAPDARLRWARWDEANHRWTAADVDAKVGGDGLVAHGQLTLGGRYRLAEDVVAFVLPYWARVFGAPAQVTALHVPPGRDVDPAPDAAAIEEGMTVPVVLRGANFWPGHTRILPENFRIESSQGVRPAPAGVEDRLRIATVLVAATGDEAAFTIRSEPIEELGAGETLLADLRVERTTTSGTPVDSTVAPEPLRIRGLPELIVRPGETDVHTIDGRAVHFWTDQSGRFSTIRVEEGARLGVGRPVGSAVAIEGETYDLSTLFRAETHLGRMLWIDRAASGVPLPDDEPITITDSLAFRQSHRLFQPLQSVVRLDVTGPVEVDGEIYFAGMRGGERNFTTPDPGKGWFGGLAADRPSGGGGGGGGVTQDEVTFPGNDAVAPGYRHDGAIVAANAATGGRELAPQGYDGARWATDLKAVGDVIGGVYSAGQGVASFNILSIFSIAKGVGSVAGGLGALFSPSRTKCAAQDCPAGASPCVSSYCPRIGGEGGNGGEFSYGHGRTLSLDPADVWFPGTGGGGGGGGGSSYIEGEVFDVIDIYTDEEEGGGGAGGGGAAGALHLVSARSVAIGPRGGLVGTGGRGGFGEMQRVYAGPGGGGGGGSGGLLKLQAPLVDNQGRIELSGGDGGGAFLGFGASHIPHPLWPEALILDGDNHGGQLVYRRGQLEVDLLYPSGRERGSVTLPIPGGIAGISNMYLTLGRRTRTIGLWVATTQARLYYFQAPDFGTRSIPPFATPLSFVDLSNQQDANGSYVFRGGFTITDVAQSPLPPHHLFVSGFRRNPEEYDEAKTFILELDSGGTFVRTAYGSVTAVQRRVRGEDECPVTPDFLDAIDFLSDGALVALATYSDPFGENELSGVYRIDLAARTRRLLMPVGSETRSLSVLRGTDEGDLLALVHYSCFANVSGGPPPPRNGIQLRRFTLAGAPANEVGLWADTLAWPGEPGFARIDGAYPGASEPTFTWNGHPLEDLRFEGSPLTYRAAVLASFLQPYNGYAFGDLVTFTDARYGMGGGGPPGHAPDLCVGAPDGSVQCRSTSAPADDVGFVVGLAPLSPGFNRVWFRPDNNPVEELLVRDVYRLEGPENPRVFEPR